jgi:putative restriction endonuclease
MQFLLSAPGSYQAILPAFISGWDPAALKARVAFGTPDQEAVASPSTPVERRYALRAVKQRLHQASFREAVIAAYNGRCALSSLPEPLLLEAAHIMALRFERFNSMG